jgi:solute carrier family 35 protein C2
MFSPDRFTFHCPLFATSLYMLVQFILAGILRYSLPTHFKPEQPEHKSNPRD